MKYKKQLLSGALSALVFCSATAFPAVPAFAQDDAYTDGFEGYAVYQEADDTTYAVVNSNQTIADGNWKATDLIENQWWKDSKLYVEQCPDSLPDSSSRGKVLRLDRAGDNSVTPVEWTAPHPGLSGGYQLSYEFHRDPIDRGTPACFHPLYFNISADGTSYYELNNFDASGRPFSLFHVEDGQRTAVINGNPNGWGWCEQADKNTWVRVEVTFYNGALTYRFSDALGTQKVFEQGSGVDPDPLILSGDEIRIAIGNGTPKPMWIDNFSAAAYDPFLQQREEPASVVYDDLARSAPFSDGVFSLPNEVRIRKVKTSAPVKVEASADGSSYVTLAEVNGEWLNTENSDCFRYVRIQGLSDPSGVSLFGEVDLSRQYSMVFQSQYRLSAKIDGVSGGIRWNSSNARVAEAADGVIETHNKGECVLTAEVKGKSLSIPVRVLGEMDMAEQNGTADAYLAQKKTAVDAFNSAAEADSETGMAEWLTADTNASLSYIRDFDHTLIEALDQKELAALGKRLLSYPQTALSMEGVKGLIEAVETEIYVGELDGLSADEIKAYFSTNERTERFGLALTDPYYLKYTDGVAAALAGQTFASLDNLQELFTQACLMIPFGDIISAASYGDLLPHFQAFIGYDEARYQSIADKQAFYDALILQKKDIATPEQLRAFIDTYTPPPKPTPSRGSGGSGGGGGGNHRPGLPSGGGVILPRATPAPPPEEQKPVQKFPDVAPEHWAYEDVSALSALQIMDGYEDGTFRPEEAITRAEFVKLLTETFQMTAGEGTESFADVSEADWFYQPVLAARSNQILRGDGGRCYPNAVITREEMAALAFRSAEAEGLKLKTVAVPVFADQDMVSEWALIPVMRLCTAGVLNGMPDGTFQPGEEVTRAQAACAVNRLRGLPVIQSENSET